MTYDTLVEIVAAVHLSQYVRSSSKSRGGLMIVAPPGGLKSTISETMNEFPRTFILSDINQQQLVKMRQYFLSSEVQTLGFTDFAKLYKRNPSVAKNLEGTIMGLVDEGFRRASFQTQVPSTIVARCTIMGAMTISFYEQMIEEWTASGFGRRFLWARYYATGFEVLEQAALDDRLAVLSKGFVPRIPSNALTQSITVEEKIALLYMTRHVHYRNGALVMLRKILTILKWKFGAKKANAILSDFAPCLGKDGGVLEIEEVNGAKERRTGKPPSKKA